MLGSVRKHQMGGEAPAPRKPRNYEETNAQRKVVEWLRARPDWMVLRLENAQRRTGAQVTRDKAMGMEPGAPDLILLYKRRVIWLEMKTTKTHTSKIQDNIHHQLRLRGQIVIVAYGEVDAIWQLEAIEC